MLTMKMNRQRKYIVCVGVTVALTMTLGYFMQHSVDEKVALVLSGGPLFIYLHLARLFHAGEHFNYVLIVVVFTGYIAAFLAPLYYIFRSYKWSLVFVQTGLVIVHFLIGLVLVI